MLFGSTGCKVLGKDTRQIVVESPAVLDVAMVVVLRDGSLAVQYVKRQGWSFFKIFILKP